MNNAQTALTLAEQGAVADAYSVLFSNAESGDAACAFLLAQWRMAGDLIRRDLRESRRLYGLAAELGHVEAEAPFTALLANGAGGSGRHWADAVLCLKQSKAPESVQQVELLGAMKIDEDGNPLEFPVPVRLLDQPCVWKISQFLTPAECKYVRDLAGPLLTPAVVYHPITGALIRDPVRRSSAASFPFIMENPAIHAINRRIAAATQTEYEQGEPIQVLAYTAGEEYKCHSDAISGERNQRVLTLLVYLTDHFEGGETHFPAIDWSFKGKIGDALLFRNVDRAGRPDSKAVHQGRLVSKGLKMVLSKWIRHNPLDLSGPSGRPF